jgi:hypothetical protein
MDLKRYYKRHLDVLLGHSVSAHSNVLAHL